MRLELGKIHIKDVQFGAETKVEAGVLYVNEDAIRELVLEDERIKECRVERLIRVNPAVLLRLRMFWSQELRFPAAEKFSLEHLTK